MVAAQQLAKRRRVHRVGPRGEEFDGVEAEGLGLSAGGGEVVAEDERAGGGFGDEADGHGRADHDEAPNPGQSSETTALMTPVSGLV